jgi:hypothetical protein
MLTKVTLEQVEQLAVQLPPQEQLKLLSRLSERLTEAISLHATNGRKERAREAAAILRACDRAAAAFIWRTDSVETVRRMRDERHRQICQSGS